MQSQRSNRNSWAIVLLLVVIVCAISYGVATVGVKIFRQNSFGSSRTVSITNLQDLQTTQDGFVCYDGNAVSFYSSSGDARWSYLVGVNAAFYASNYGVAAWSGKTITLIDIDSGVTTYNGMMEDSVISAHVGVQYTAILMGEESGDSTMLLMENGGRQVNRIEFNDVLPVDYGFYSNGTLLWVMVCDSNGTVPTCTIQTYKPSKEIVGSISDTEQLIYSVSFLSSQVCVVGDTYVKVYDYTGIEDITRRKLAYGWYMTAADKTTPDPLMAFVTDAQYSTSNIHDVRLIRSNLDSVVRMPFGCMDIAVSGDTVYGFSADGHMMILPATAKKADAYKLNITIDRVYGVTKDGVAVLGSGSLIYLVRLS